MYKFYPVNGYDLIGHTKYLPSGRRWHTVLRDPNLKHWLMRINLTCFLLFFAFLQLSIAANAQNVTLSKNGASLSAIFREIKKQTGYDFIYKSDLLKTGQPVDIQVKDEPLILVLNKCFENQPFTYSIKDKTIIVKEKDKNHVNKGADIQSVPINLHGQVLDENNQPLPGATVRIKGQKQVTTTDEKGKFSINIQQDNTVLQVSYIGYEPFEIVVNTNDDIKVIELKKATSKLDQIQIIGYGETSKRFSTGSSSTVNESKIENQPVTNPLATIQGQVPGVFVQTQNGLPGGNIKIQIRGQGSLASGTDPLFIVDGVPFLSAPIYNAFGSAGGANGGISPFNIINPDDIESISILKDADATAIYGSRAANGVVLINTKKGAIGKDHFTVDVNQGISQVSRLNSYLNLQQYLKLRNDAYKNDGLVPDVNSAPDLLVWDTTKSTNWQKYFYGGTANVTNIQASLSGGDANTHYLANLNYHDEGTILPGNENYKKGGGYLNIDHTSTNKKFYTSFNVNYNGDDNHTLYNSTGDGSGSTPPDFPIYNSDGSYNWTITNPVAILNQKQHSTTSYLNANTVMKYSFTTGFDAKLNIGYNTYKLNQVATLPVSSEDPSYSPIATAFFANNSSNRYIIEPQFDYIKHFNEGVLTAVLGGTYQHIITQGNYIEGDGVSNPDLLGNIGAASILTGNSDSYSEYKYESVFGRINYNWKQKYLIDVNLRRVGSSRFGPGRQFGNFYAVGGGWIFSEEKFIKDNLGFLSYGKIRSSYGLTGNDQISDYQYLSTYRSGTTYGGISTLTPSKVANPNYSWETTKKFELALELGFLKDRILLTTAWYKNTSGNQLISYAIPYVTGFATYQANFPAVIQNTGLEIELNTQPVKGSNFSWNASFNITLPKNKLISFPGLATSSYATTYVVGQDLSIVKAFQFLGVDPKTGLAEYKDVNKDGQLSFLDDAVIAGKTSPELFGGFSNDFNYKGIQLDVFFEFVKHSLPGYVPALGTGVINDPQYVVNRWEKSGDVVTIPGATTNYANFQDASTSFFTDASYIRLKNLALSYNFKSSLLQKWKLKGIKIYVQGENLFVIANKQRFDPEISSSAGAIPPLKTLTAGIKLTL